MNFAWATPGRVLLGALAGIVLAKFAYLGWQEWQLTKPGFHDTSCWFSTRITGEARCGYLVVPENRQRADSRTIRLPVVIFEAVQKKRWGYDPPKEPVIYLTGGPGDQAYLGEQEHVDSWWLERRMFEGRALIVMGQRGTGLKDVDFDCDEFDTPEIALGAHPPEAPPPDRRSLAIEAAKACAARLQDDGVDLTAYNSRESAADIAELRLALGIEAWNLFGVSYGTRLALSVLRYHPEGVRSAILDSVFPPEATNLIDSAALYHNALYRYLNGCDGVSPCYPAPNGPWMQYTRARDRLNKSPVEVDLREIDPDSDLMVSIDNRAFDELLFQALYFRETRQLILPVIGQVSGLGTATRAGNSEGATALRDLQREVLLSYGSGSNAVYLSHICHDEAPFETAGEIAAAVALAGPLGHMISEDSNSYLCDFWPSGAADPVENTPVVSEVPVLLLAGAFDPVTPLDLALSAAGHLPNSYTFELADAGHGVVYEVDCAQSLVTEFLVHPGRRPGGDCRYRDFRAPPPKSAEISR